MDEIPLFVLGAATLLMLVASLIEGIGWLVPLTAPLGIVSAFLSIEKRN